MHSSLGLAIERGLSYLGEHQYPNGEFCAYSAGDDAMVGWCRPDRTVFPTALIGHCLLAVREWEGARGMLRSTAAFLRAQMARGGTWNHFTLGHPLRALCPMDADDTACTSSLLAALDVPFPQKENTALLLANRRRDGLFYTWFHFHGRPGLRLERDHLALRLRILRRPLQTLVFWRRMECGPNDVDAVVNANLLYYLGDRPETKPIARELCRIIEAGAEGDCDKWYRHPLSVYYFMTRAYRRGLLPDLDIKLIRERIARQAAPDGGFGESALHTALALCTLLDIRADDLARPAAEALLREQGANGSWPRWRLYYGGPSLVNGYGSEELTTAFCLEALGRYREGLR